MFGIPIPSLTEIKLGLIAASILGLVVGTAWVTHKVDASKYQSLIIDYQKAETEAKQQEINRLAQLDEIKTQAALEEVQKQQQIAQNTKEQLDEALKYSNAHCITNGIISVLNNAASNSDTKSGLPSTSGKSLTACSTVTADKVLKSIIINYGIYNQTAEQLNKLIDTINKMYGEHH